MMMMKMMKMMMMGSAQIKPILLLCIVFGLISHSAALITTILAKECVYEEVEYPGDLVSGNFVVREHGFSWGTNERVELVVFRNFSSPYFPSFSFFCTHCRVTFNCCCGDFSATSSIFLVLLPLLDSLVLLLFCTRVCDLHHVIIGLVTKGCWLGAGSFFVLEFDISHFVSYRVSLQISSAQKLQKYHRH
jgi:hypothetical protein